VIRNTAHNLILQIICCVVIMMQLSRDF